MAFAEKSESWVKGHFTKPGVQTWLELNGTPCIDTAEVKRNKTICTSRSFGNMVSELSALRASVASFAGSCANKLRSQGSVCSTVIVFITSNRFREDLPQYSNSASRSFLVSTSDTLEITEAALRCLADIYVPNIMYKKSGVILTGIIPESPLQLHLFDPNTKRKERKNLMRVLDGINHRYGVKTLRLAVEGTSRQSWHVKCEHRSPNYLTNIDEILTI